MSIKSNTELDNLKVCAVVVTYNRKNLLRECLQALLSQTRPLNEIILVDNASTDGTDQMVSTEFDQVTYVKLPENIGGAGGFHEGMKLAYEKGYDWIWVMDDDVAPKGDCLKILLNESQKIDVETSGILPARVDPKGKKIDWYPFFSKWTLRSRNTSPLKSNTIYFEGLFINKKLIDKIGFPNKDFFMVLDDTEYGLRISLVGKIQYTNAAILIRLTETLHTHPLNRRYYFFRNLFLLSKLHKIPIFWVMIVVFVQVFFSICKTFFKKERNKKQVSRILIKAYLDGIFNRFGKLHQLAIL